MALMEVFHVVASQHPIDASASPDIPQGSLVSIGSDGLICLANGEGTITNAGVLAIGIAGDSRSHGVTSYNAEDGSALSRNPTSSLTGSLVIGANGKGRRFTAPHVSDNYNEVLASGKMTVYHSGGEFWTDQYETIWNTGTNVAMYLPSTRLYCSGSENAVTYTPSGTTDVASNGGKFTDEVGSKTVDMIVGQTLHAPMDYPSGVPGTDVPFNSLPEGGNSLAWGRFLHVKLSI